MDEATKELREKYLQTEEATKNVEDLQVAHEVRFFDTGEPAQIPVRTKDSDSDDPIEERRRIREGLRPSHEATKMVPLIFTKEPEKGIILSTTIPGKGEFRYLVTDPLSKDSLERWPDAIFVERLVEEKYEELKKTEGFKEGRLQEYLPENTVSMLQDKSTQKEARTFPLKDYTAEISDVGKKAKGKKTTSNPGFASTTTPKSSEEVATEQILKQAREVQNKKGKSAEEKFRRITQEKKNK